MPHLATNAEQMPRSGICRIMDLAWSLDQPVIGLHVGEPGFATPDHVRQAAEDALGRGETRYVPNAGITPLRNAISDKVARHNHISASPEQVIVSAGGMQALYVALSATVQSGDEVLIPDPRLAELRHGSAAASGQPRPVPVAPRPTDHRRPATHEDHYLRLEVAIQVCGLSLTFDHNGRVPGAVVVQVLESTALGCG
jgi:aspartate/methionine/tyrosine aminotransferase